jgi:ABC-type uncharacterized transport system permease subunit
MKEGTPELSPEMSRREFRRKMKHATFAALSSNNSAQSHMLIGLGIAIGAIGLLAFQFFASLNQKLSLISAGDIPQLSRIILTYVLLIACLMLFLLVIAHLFYRSMAQEERRLGHLLHELNENQFNIRE